MNLGDRLRDRLAASGISQSELARRVSLNQSTIAGLINGKSRSSAHLHRIARELGTTPAYLSGETDDPEADAPEEPILDSRTRDLVNNFSMISPADQRAVVHLVQSLAGAAAASTTIHVPRSAFKGRDE